MLFSLYNISIVKNRKQLLNPFNLSIPEKTDVCISGPSGAGKTTFIRLFNQMTIPTTGEIYYKNTKISDSDLTLYRRKIAMVFQEPVVLSGLVRDNLILPFQIKRWQTDIAESRIAEICDLCKLPPSLLTQDSHILSGGEKQRVAIGRALLVNPEVMLMDEPTSALDMQTAQSIMQNIRQGYPDLTFIIVSHAKELINSCQMHIQIKVGNVITDN